MVKMQKVFYWAGVVSVIISAYSGFEAIGESNHGMTNTLGEVAAALYPVGFAVTAVAFAILALVCFKATEIKPP